MGKVRPADGVNRYVDGLIDEIRRQVPVALCDFQAEAIHKSRVATRRLKAATDLLAPIVAAKPRRAIRRAGRRLRRQLGPLRDLDVMIGHLNELGGGDESAVAWLRDRLLERRDAARRRAASRSGHSKALAKLVAWWDLRADVLRSRQQIPVLLAESLRTQLTDFTRRAAELNDPVAGPSSDPHELRIAGKLLRYTLELADAGGTRLPISVFRGFKRMQDALGLWHDYGVLTRTICELSAENSVALHDAGLQEGLLGLARRTLARSRRELGNFSRLWLQNGAAISEVIRGRFGPSPAEAQSPSSDVGTSETVEPESPPSADSFTGEPSATESQTDRDPETPGGNGHPSDPPQAAEPAA